jgi:hypothetical protein
MTNDTIEVHFKGAGLAYDAKIAPGDSIEAEKARKVATFILDMVAGDPSTTASQARKLKRSRAEMSAETLAATDIEAESL